MFVLGNVIVYNVWVVRKKPNILFTSSFILYALHVPLYQRMGILILTTNNICPDLNAEKINGFQIFC